MKANALKGVLESDVDECFWYGLYEFKFRGFSRVKRWSTRAIGALLDCKQTVFIDKYGNCVVRKDIHAYSSPPNYTAVTSKGPRTKNERKKYEFVYFALFFSTQ